MEPPTHVTGISEHSKKEPEAEHEVDKTVQEGKNTDFSSAPTVSSSSSSSSSALLESDTGEKGMFDGSFDKPKFDGNMSAFPEYVFSPDITNGTPPWSMMSASPPAGIGMHLWPELSTASPDLSVFNNGLEAKSQSMRQPGGYDPNRIPASIFSSKPTNPSEWSITSNESLFSIHMSNNSFTRKNAIVGGKSAELLWLDELHNTQYSFPSVSEAKCNESSSGPVSLPPLMEVPAQEKNGAKSGKVSTLEKEDSNSRVMISKGTPAEAVPPPAIVTGAPDLGGALPPESHTSSTTPRLSDGSRASSQSFAFPVLVQDGEKTGSVNWITRKHVGPQQQERAPKATPKASRRKRWCCFSCWRRCCC